MDPIGKATLAAGLFYIGTFVFSIPALGCTTASSTTEIRPRRRQRPGRGVGRAHRGPHRAHRYRYRLALYRVIKRHGPSRAVGFVASRTLETAMTCAGVLAVLAAYTLRQDFPGTTDTATLTITASGLVPVKDWSFLV